MPTQGPWYISATAVRELMAIKGLPTADDGDAFEACELELIELARSIVASGKPGKDLDSGGIRYRGPNPLRLRLTVMPAPRREGSKPQLVQVRPDHEGRAPGLYKQVNKTKPQSVRDAAKAAKQALAAGAASPASSAPAYGSHQLLAPDDEREAWRRAAERAGVPLSEWIRDVLRRASRG